MSEHCWHRVAAPDSIRALAAPRLHYSVSKPSTATIYGQPSVQTRGGEAVKPTASDSVPCLLTACPAAVRVMQRLLGAPWTLAPRRHQLTLARRALLAAEVCTLP